jgi:uncharacterized membrane protein
MSRIAQMFGLSLLMAGMLGLAAARPAAAQAYTITEIPTLRTDGGGTSAAFSINIEGQVVGQTDTDDGTRRGYLWSLDTGLIDFRDLQIYLGGPNSSGFAIGDAGDIGGEVNTPSTPTEPFPFGHAFAFRPGAGMADLNTMGGQNSVTKGINTSGQGAGSGQDASGVWHAFRYEPNSNVNRLDVPGAPQSHGFAITNLGEVAGSADLPNQTRAAVWLPTGTIFTWTMRGSRATEAYGINDNRQVVGSGRVRQNGRERIMPFIGDLNTQRVRPLPTLAGARYSSAQSINNNGLIVGCSGPLAPVQRRAVLWRRGRIIDLNRQIPRNSGWVLVMAWDISENGWIVGEGFLNGQHRGFLLQPVAQ